MAISKMWRSPIFEKHFFPAENAGNMLEKPDFWHLLEILPLVFFWFFAQRWILGLLKTWPSPIFEKNFFPVENTGNIPEIAVFADFHRTFFSYFVVFSHKHYLQPMCTTKHGWIVNITDFCCRNFLNFLKIPGTANFCRKNGISWISQAVLNIFS